MVTTGFCESCGGRVALNEDYSCTNGHPASQVHNIQGSEIAEPTWAVGSDGKRPQRRLPGSSLMLVGGMLLAATVVGISVATVLGNASARRAMVSRPTQVLVAAAPAPSSPISFVSTGSTSVQATIATHGTNPVDTTNAMAPTIVSGQRYTSGKRTTRINVGDIVYFRSKTGSRLV